MRVSIGRPAVQLSRIHHLAVCVYIYIYIYAGIAATVVHPTIPLTHTRTYICIRQLLLPRSDPLGEKKAEKVASRSELLGVGAAAGFQNNEDRIEESLWLREATHLVLRERGGTAMREKCALRG